MPDLSVIIPCYNAERYIAATLDSVLAQTLRPAEVLVIDDGSTDGSAAIIRQYAQQPDSPIQLIQQANAGESRARNVGIQRATSPFIAFLDADDIWMPDKTARQLALLQQHPDAVCVHCRIFNFRDEIDDLDREETELSKDDPTLEDLLTYHWVSISTMIVRAEALKGAEPLRFEESVQHSEDMLFIAELRLRGRLCMLDELALAKRTHANQQTKNPWHPIYSIRSRVEWYRANAARLEPQLVAKLDEHFAHESLRVLENRYWQRQIDGLVKARDIVRELFPDQLAAHPMGGRRIYPRWLYALKDAITGKPRG